MMKKVSTLLSDSLSFRHSRLQLMVEVLRIDAEERKKSDLDGRNLCSEVTCPNRSIAANFDLRPIPLSKLNSKPTHSP